MKVRGSKERRLRKSCRIFFSYGGRLGNALGVYKGLYPEIKARRRAQIVRTTYEEVRLRRQELKSLTMHQRYCANSLGPSVLASLSGGFMSGEFEAVGAGAQVMLVDELHEGWKDVH